MRWQRAYDHFFPISDALRRLETSGKPIAVAISGLALGGGCELALAAHYRVMTNEKRSAIGLPESLVGLFPGGGGTQRLPRLVGVQASLPILLEGKRLTAQDALKAGLAHELAAPGREIDVAEEWVLSCQDARQPWDRSTPSFRANELHRILDLEMESVLQKTRGHYPAPLAILGCLRDGLTKPFDEAMRVETGHFAGLIQRREPRNMITTLFLGRLAFDKLSKAGGIPEIIGTATKLVASAWDADEATTSALAMAGFGGASVPKRPGGWVSEDHFWHESPPQTPEKKRVQVCLEMASELAGKCRDALSQEYRLAADYILATQYGFPPYLAGVFGGENEGGETLNQVR
jgi:3-hydroxyacyl-CoA dehydrogenase/enoyl-CoA hydratase/3-hydroxybutyryl-CoA epimerase